jgi:hypothetical protein
VKANTTRKLFPLALFVCVGLVSGCRATRTTSSIPLKVSLAPNWPQTLMGGQKLEITATVANDASNSGVHWSLSGVGHLSVETPNSVTYTAPVNLSSDQYTLIKATAIADSASTATLQITVLAHGRQ